MYSQISIHMMNHVTTSYIGIISMVFSADGESAYAGLAGPEFSWPTASFSRDPTTGALTLIKEQQIGGQVTSLDISPDAKYVYAVATGVWTSSDSLYALEVAQDGTLSVIEQYGELGYSNRGGIVSVSPDGANVYAQMNGRFVWYSRDDTSGKLTVVQQDSDSLLGSSQEPVFIDDHMYISDLTGNLQLYSVTTSALTLVETYTTIACWSGCASHVVAYDDTVHFANGISVHTYERDASTGKLTHQSYITDDDDMLGHMVGTDHDVFIGSLVFTRQTPPSGATTDCALTITDLSAGTSGTCHVAVDPARHVTYDCNLGDESPLTQLEFDRVPLRSDPSVSLVTFGWQNSSTRAYSRFTFTCQDPLTTSDAFSCQDEITLVNNRFIAEQFELYVSPAMVTICRGTQCCIVGVDGGNCSPPGYTVTPADECSGGYRLSSDFTGLDACVVKPEGTQLDPPRMLQRVFRYGASYNLPIHFKVGVMCTPE